jgi:hypothetical protein
VASPSLSLSFFIMKFNCDYNNCDLRLTLFTITIHHFASEARPGYLAATIGYDFWSSSYVAGYVWLVTVRSAKLLG